ncbi:hypothetical protein OSI40_23145, partial [Mycobacterium ulcerans]
MNFRLYAGRRCTVDPAAPLSLPGYSALLAPEPPALPSAPCSPGLPPEALGAPPPPPWPPRQADDPAPVRTEVRHHRV